MKPTRGPQAENDNHATADVPVDSVRLGGFVSRWGDWHEHDLAALAPVIAERRGTFRICFDVIVSRVPSSVASGGYHPVIITEGIPGYTPTTFDIGSKARTCLDNVRRANAALGLSPADVRAITASSFDRRDAT